MYPLEANMVAGDLIAHTGRTNTLKFFGERLSNNSIGCFPESRKSKDCRINSGGKRLPSLIANNGLTIANSCFLFDREGDYTCINHGSTCVTAYFIGSLELLNLIETLCVADYRGSDHLPLQPESNVQGNKFSSSAFFYYQPIRPVK